MACSTSMKFLLLVILPLSTAQGPPSTDIMPLFNPSKSTSMNLDMGKPLMVRYADANTELSGYTCSDTITLGGYTSEVKFACFTDAPSQAMQFWSQMGNGVLGLGPVWQKQHDEAGRKMPEPVMAQMAGVMDSQKDMLTKKFAFMSRRNAAELQLGGYVPGSIVGQMRTTKSLSSKMYTLGIKSMRIGNTFDDAEELLVFGPTATKHYVPALLDTGSPCIMLPSNAEGQNLQFSPYAQYQNRMDPWKKMFITVDGIDQGLEITYEELLVEHHTFLDAAWGTSIRPCVMPVTWDIKPPHQTPIVLGAVFFRAFNVLFDNARASATVPPTIGLAKQNPSYNPIGISENQAVGRGADGDAVHRVFVQHTPIKVVNGVEKVGVANPNGHQFFTQLSVGSPPQHMRVVVDTGSPLFGLFVNPKSLTDYEKGVSNVPHRRPAPLEPTKTSHLAGSASQGGEPERGRGDAGMRKGGKSAADVRGSARKSMNQLVKVLPIVGVVVLVALLVFIKYRRQFMLNLYWMTKPDLPYR